MYKNLEIVMIAAIGENREMGLDNDLLWHLPNDLPRFKELTMGFPIIMGRKTYESIGKPLAGRKNIVMSKDAKLKIEGVDVVNSVSKALASGAECFDKVFVIGGAEIYKLFMPYATRLELTEVDDAPEADTFFPKFDDRGFYNIHVEYGGANPDFYYVTYSKD